MERSELLKHYDRFVDQVRTEVKDLYWLYNFFFFVNSAMIAGVFFGKIAPQFSGLVEILGLCLSAYWLTVIRKQRLWRNDWVERIQMLEEKLGYEKEYWMWKYRGTSPKTINDYVFGKRGLWDWLYLLPIGFAATWVILLVSN